MSEEQVNSDLKEIPDDKAVLIWEQWKYRHSFFWKAFYLLTTTVAILSTLPLINSSILTDLGILSLSLPIIGLAIGHWGKLLIEAEYKRIAVVGDKYSTAPWSFGTSKMPPFKTDVGKPVIDFIAPALRIACYAIPILSGFAVLVAYATKT